MTRRSQLDPPPWSRVLEAGRVLHRAGTSGTDRDAPRDWGRSAGQRPLPAARLLCPPIAADCPPRTDGAPRSEAATARRVGPFSELLDVLERLRAATQLELQLWPDGSAGDRGCL